MNPSPTSHAGAGITPMTRYVAKGLRQTDMMTMAWTAPDAPKKLERLSYMHWAALAITAAPAYNCRNCK